MTELAQDLVKTSFRNIGAVPGTNADQTKRKDAGKLRLDLVPAEWVEGLAQVSQMGAEKYAPWAWAKRVMEPWRMKASALRHTYAWIRGERVDPESGLDHRLHAAWNLLASYYYDVNGMVDSGEDQNEPKRRQDPGQVVTYTAPTQTPVPPFEHESPATTGVVWVSP